MKHIFLTPEEYNDTIFETKTGHRKLWIDLRSKKKIEEKFEAIFSYPNFPALFYQTNNVELDEELRQTRHRALEYIYMAFMANEVLSEVLLKMCRKGDLLDHVSYLDEGIITSIGLFAINLKKRVKEESYRLITSFTLNDNSKSDDDDIDPAKSAHDLTFKIDINNAFMRYYSIIYTCDSIAQLVMEHATIRASRDMDKQKFPEFHADLLKLGIIFSGRSLSLVQHTAQHTFLSTESRTQMVGMMLDAIDHTANMESIMKNISVAKLDTFMRIYFIRDAKDTATIKAYLRKEFFSNYDDSTLIPKRLLPFYRWSKNYKSKKKEGAPREVVTFNQDVLSE